MGGPGAAAQLGDSSPDSVLPLELRDSRVPAVSIWGQDTLSALGVAQTQDPNMEMWDLGC